jgi:hypothetical protein
MTPPSAPRGRPAFRDGAVVLLVLAAAALWLAMTARQGFLELSWSDEIVYAVMGRNIADGRGIATSFYDMRALLRDGHPQGDVHMPGHALFMSAFFRVLGSADWVAFAPSWAGLLASAVTVQVAVRRSFDTRTGAWAAALLLVMPGLAGYAHSAMSELTLVFASSLFLLTWSACTTPARAAFMAAALAAGVLCRETALVFLLPATEALWRAPREVRGRLAAAFTLTLALCLGALAPLYLDRARFPHFLSDLPAFGSNGWGPAVLGVVRGNLRPPLPGGLDQQQFATLLALATLVSAVVWLLPLEAPAKRLSAVLLALTAANFAGLAGFYPLRGWAGVRAFMFLSPWIAAVLAPALVRGRHAWWRGLAAGLVVCALGAWSWRATVALAQDRRAEQRENAAVAGAYERMLGGLDVGSLVAFESPWEIGWRRFPITIVWNVPADPESLRRVNAVLPIDAVMGRNAQVLPLAEASQHGELGLPYELLPRRPTAERQALVRSGLRGSVSPP